MEPVPEAHQEGACRDRLSELCDYLDGELEVRLCARLEAHLAECRDCRVMVDTLRRTITLYRDQPVADLPGEVQQRLYQVLELT